MITSKEIRSSDQHGVQRSRWSTLSYRLAMLIGALLALSAIVTTTFSVQSVQTSMFDQSHESMDNVHTSVNALITAEYQSVVDFRAAALASRRLELANVSAPLVASLDQFRSTAASGEMTLAQAQANALLMLKTVRYGSEHKDYFFTYDRSLTAISHPDAKFQGKNLTDFQDADGKFVIRELRDMALNHGAGYVDYRWVRLNETQPSAKIGYVFHYLPWDWIIGTGVYVDDIDLEAAKRLAAIKANLSQSFDQVRFSSAGLFFVLDKAGSVVVAPASKDLSVVGSSSADAGLSQAILSAAPTTDGPIYQLARDATFGAAATEPWVMNVSTFSPLDWTLVSAVPKSELAAPGRTLALQQAMLNVVVLVIGLGGGLLMSRRIVRPVESVTKAALALADDDFDPATLDTAAARKDEVGELARVFRRMGIELVARERRLRDQVAKLTVVIDRSKVAEDVGEITESDYFQRLKTRADEMRRDRAN